eukprot:5775978-Pleurochrysis_carterae.AAC.6
MIGNLHSAFFNVYDFQVAVVKCAWSCADTSHVYQIASNATHYCGLVTHNLTEASDCSVNLRVESIVLAISKPTREFCREH